MEEDMDAGNMCFCGISKNHQHSVEAGTHLEQYPFESCKHAEDNDEQLRLLAWRQ
jgi:hypothetical protein